MKIKGDPQWAMRRARVDAVLVGGTIFAIYAVVHGPEMANVVIPHVTNLVIFVMGFYVGGAVAERLRGVPGGNIIVDDPDAGGRR